MPTKENIPLAPLPAASGPTPSATANKSGLAPPPAPARFDVSTLPPNFAHDLNNCIAIINGYSEVCLAHLAMGGNDEKILKYVNAIHDAAQQAASFTRQLMVLSSGKRTPTASRPVNGFPPGNESLLVIEDEAVLRDMLQTVLGQHGYRITLAGTGEQATRIFANSPKAFDLVLLDLQLPDTPGIIVLNRIRQMNPRQKAVAVSGCTDAETDAALERLGVVDHLLKPYHLVELGRAIRDVLAR
jgi:CheY-like chemotaxis protein